MGWFYKHLSSITKQNMKEMFHVLQSFQLISENDYKMVFVSQKLIEKFKKWKETRAFASPIKREEFSDNFC